MKKGDPIVEIFVPELHEDRDQKVAQVELRSEDGRGGRRAKSTRRLPKSRRRKPMWTDTRPTSVLWESEVQRFTKMVEQHVMAQQDLDETQKQLLASRSARDAAVASVAAREAAAGLRRSRRGNRPGPSQGGRGGAAPHRSHAGLYQRDRSLRWRDHRSQCQYRRLCAGGHGR